MGEGACVTWGLGVRVFTNGNGRLPQGTFGWSGAYGTHFWVDPINKIVAVYMKNSLYDGGSGAATSAHFEEDVINSIIYSLKSKTYCGFRSNKLLMRR